MDRVDVVVIGAGAVGLAIASEIADGKRDIFVREKESKYGQGTSSRSSEVIHAGIYYPSGSLKGQLGVRGSEMLYEICREGGVAHKPVGKLIVATKDDEVKGIENLYKQGCACSARDLEMIDEDEIRKLEPNVKAVAAVLSPSTGIIDSHGLM